MIQPGRRVVPRGGRRGERNIGDNALMATSMGSEYLRCAKGDVLVELSPADLTDRGRSRQHVLVEGRGERTQAAETEYLDPAAELGQSVTYERIGQATLIGSGLDEIVEQRLHDDRNARDVPTSFEGQQGVGHLPLFVRLADNALGRR